MGTEAVWVPWALAALSAGVQVDNTRRTEKRADSALANQIRNQSNKQREADAKVNERVSQLEGDTAADERASRLDDYVQTLRANRGRTEAGLTPVIGSGAFRADAANDAADVNRYAADTAGLLSRIDAAGLQRQGEAFGYGNLATDLNLIGREAEGLNFLDNLRVQRAARRNAGQDALAAGLSAASSSTGSGSGGGNYTLTKAGSNRKVYGGGP